MQFKKMILYGMVRGYVCLMTEHKREIMKEVHKTIYSVHPRSTKMYKDLKEYYWWNNMKREITDFVSKCLTCQLVKEKHQKPTRLL